jgi:hypothetical protein
MALGAGEGGLAGVAGDKFEFRVADSSKGSLYHFFNFL